MSKIREFMVAKGITWPQTIIISTLVIFLGVVVMGMSVKIEHGDADQHISIVNNTDVFVEIFENGKPALFENGANGVVAPGEIRGFNPSTSAYADDSAVALQFKVRQVGAQGKILVTMYEARALSTGGLYWPRTSIVIEQVEPNKYELVMSRPTPLASR